MQISVSYKIQKNSFKLLSCWCLHLDCLGTRHWTYVVVDVRIFTEYLVCSELLDVVKQLDLALNLWLYWYKKTTIHNGLSVHVVVRFFWNTCLFLVPTSS